MQRWVVLPEARAGEVDNSRIVQQMWEASRTLSTPLMIAFLVDSWASTNFALPGFFRAAGYGGCLPKIIRAAGFSLGEPGL